ncbi:MAG: response regulator [Cyclobacteriaceae bacterium]
MSQSVLIVDDDKLILMLFERMIKHIKPKIIVDTYTNVEAALAQLSNASINPDVIFLDLNMPIINGWEFLNGYLELKEKLSLSSRIYILTSSIDKKDKVRADAVNNVAGFLEKPVTLDKLTDILNNEFPE